MTPMVVHQCNAQGGKGVGTNMLMQDGAAGNVHQHEYDCGMMCGQTGQQHEHSQGDTAATHIPPYLGQAQHDVDH